MRSPGRCEMTYQERVTGDRRLADAIAHWKPRFTANGVTAPDFERITASLEAWEGWCAAWSEVAAEHERLGREALADGRRRSAGAHLARAAVYYHFAKFVFVEDLEQMRSAHARAVRCLDDALPHLDPPGARVEIPFEGGTLAGVLRRPGAGRAPVVVLIPGLDSTKEEFRPTEELFLRRGLATFSVDGPGQGETEYDLAI
ncbi:MAG: alpha/beta hydrolase, partial [Actinomycetota bacterium]